MAAQANLETFQQVFADHSRSKFFARWRAVKHLTQMASTANGAGPHLSPAEARIVIEGLVAGLESVHWGVHRRCKRALETLLSQPLIEAVCDLIIEREIPRLRDIAVTARYEPQDSLRKAAYLFVLGRQQFYKAHDPDGEILVQFYEGATSAPKERLLELARTRGDQRQVQLVLGMLQHRGWARMTDQELSFCIDAFSSHQQYDKVWDLVQQRTLRWSWQAARKLAEARWLPKETHGATCWAEIQAVVRQMEASITEVQSFGQQRAVLEGHTNSVQAVAFSPDGTTLASASEDHTVRLWDAPSGQPRAVLHGHTSFVQAVAFSSAGTTLASGGFDDTIRLWDAPSGQPRAVLHGHKDWVRAVAFSPDGTTLASGTDDDTVRLWDVARGQPRAGLHGHTSFVRAVAFSPAGTTLASGSVDHTVRLWDVASGRQRAVLRGHTHWVYAVAFSPAGTTLASGDRDGTVHLWDVASCQQRAVLHDHTNSVTAVAFSPAGTTLASGSVDHTVRLWDVASGQPRAVLHGHTSSVEAVAFSPDGTTLASGSADHAVRLWNLADMSRLVKIPLAQMTTEDLQFAQRLLAARWLPAEQQAVMQYVAAILCYRLGDGTPEEANDGEPE